MNGNEVWLTGANWFGFNCSENCPHYLWSADADDCLTEIADTPAQADVFFPNYSSWHEVWLEDHSIDEKHPQRYSFVDYEK
jgi:hypothetical protein